MAKEDVFGLSWVCVIKILLTEGGLYGRILTKEYRLNAVRSVQWIFEINASDVMTADYTIIMSRTLQVTGNDVMYGRGAWFLRVIMSSSRGLWCLPTVKKQEHDFFC